MVSVSALNAGIGTSLKQRYFCVHFTKNVSDKESSQVHIGSTSDLILVDAVLGFEDLAINTSHDFARNEKMMLLSV